jgi:hypothetical protein
LARAISGSQEELLTEAKQEGIQIPSFFFGTLSGSRFSSQIFPGVSGEVYTSAVGPTAVTVFVQKIWDSMAKKA